MYYIELAWDIFSSATLNSLIFILSYIIPIIVICTMLLLIGRWMNNRLYDSFGWKGVLALAWLGTPVHEFSHIIGCIIGRNEIEEFALFKWDKRSYSLGYVKHSHRTDSFYQRVVGNTVIALAPFFGGALVIYLMTMAFFPGILSIQLGAPDFQWSDFTSIDGILGTFSIWAYQMEAFFSLLFSKANLTRWEFWIYLFAMISLATQLSPSPSDFDGFWGPAVLLLVLIFTAQIAITALAGNAWFPSINFGAFFTSINALMLLALIFLFIGAAATAIVTIVRSLFSSK